MNVGHKLSKLINRRKRLVKRINDKENPLSPKQFERLEELNKIKN